MPEVSRSLPQLPPIPTPITNDARTFAKEWRDYFELQRQVTELMRAQINELTTQADALQAQVDALDAGFTDRVLAILVDQGLI